MRRGRLVYVMGASGSGKDSLLAAVRARLEGVLPLAFLHRYITRPAAAGGENHVSLSPAAFEARRAAGAFLFHWQSCGLHYAVGVEAGILMAGGLSVVVNGSRAYWPEARRGVPGALGVLVVVPPEVLRARLLARGRENAAEVEARLARGRRLACVDHCALILDNSGPLPLAAARLADFLSGLASV